MSSFCRKCEEYGHVQEYCPLYFCNRCGRQGHHARVCSGPSSSSQSRCQNTNGKRGNVKRSICTSNLHLLPRNWKLSIMYGDSFEEAIVGLKLQGRQFTMQDVEQAEFEAINNLVQRTWQGWRVGHGVDGANLDHTSIEVVSIKRIENPDLYKKYSLAKQDMLQIPKNEWASIYTPVELIKRGTRSIWTTRTMRQDSFLRQNFFTPINEHYLFHGTKEGNVRSIAEDGFNTDLCLDRGLMGAGIYFAECSTKADMYADFRHKRTKGPKHMFLVRVLLGSSYVNTEKTKIPLKHPPCRDCLQHDCSCMEDNYFDSVVDDSGRLFRVFAVYKSDLCYPEYLITYQRGYDDNRTDAFSSHLQGSSLSDGLMSSARTARARNQMTTRQTTRMTSFASESASRSRQFRRFSSTAQRTSPALWSSTAIQDQERDLSSWSTSWSTSGVSSWSEEYLAMSEGSQWLSSPPKASYSSADHYSPSSASRGFLDRICEIFGYIAFFVLLVLYIKFFG